MYKSPIEIIQGQMRMEQENNIQRAVIEQDIHVDKHELLRALKYDRDQYEKGYRDGKADATPKWIPVSERYPTLDDMDENGEVFVCTEEGYKMISKVSQVRTSDFIAYWMPLPKKPKEE